MLRTTENPFLCDPLKFLCALCVETKPSLFVCGSAALRLGVSIRGGVRYCFGVGAGGRFDLAEAPILVDVFFRAVEIALEHLGLNAKRDNIAHRTAAMAIGVSTVQSAKQTRGLFP